MKNHINNRDLCYESENTFNNVSHNFETAEESYTELRGKNMTEIQNYHKTVLDKINEKLDSYYNTTNNQSSNDKIFIKNNIIESTNYLKDINVKIIEMLEKNNGSINELNKKIENDEDKVKSLQDKHYELDKIIDNKNKEIHQLEQDLNDNQTITNTMSKENKLFFISNIVLVSLVLFGCLYIRNIYIKLLNLE